eukprot:scaffold10266_cov294-Chaetoceros_neogracile.AAC.13
MTHSTSMVPIDEGFASSRGILPVRVNIYALLRPGTLERRATMSENYELRTTTLTCSFINNIQHLLLLIKPV